MLLYYRIPGKYRVLLVILLSVMGAFLNGLIGSTNQKLEFPFFLDSTFTILAAGLLGLAPGLLTGLLSNLFFEIFLGFPGYVLPFAVVNMTTAAATFYMVKAGFLQKASGIIWMIILLALANAFLGAILVTAIFGGTTDQPVDSVVRAIVVTGQSLLSSAFLGRILINIVDKGIGVLILYPLYRRLSRPEGERA